MFLADTNAKGRSSFYGMYNQADSCTGASGSSCLRLVVFRADVTAVQWKTEGHFPTWQTWQGGGGRDKPGGAGTWAE